MGFVVNKFRIFRAFGGPTLHMRSLGVRANKSTRNIGVVLMITRGRPGLGFCGPRGATGSPPPKPKNPSDLGHYFWGRDLISRIKIKPV